MNNKKGFTLIELLVVVLIIGILAAMALPQYFKAVERSRMGEAVTLMANIAQAQQRKYLQINKYTGDFRGLDVTPKGAQNDKFHTKGDPVNGGGNGFLLTMTANSAKYEEGAVTADRESGNSNTLQYKYQLHRYYAGNGTACKGDGTDAAAKNGAALCADFCGKDTLAEDTWCCSDGSEKTDKDVDKLGGACTVPSAVDGGAATTTTTTPTNPTNP